MQEMFASIDLFLDTYPIPIFIVGVISVGIFDVLTHNYIVMRKKVVE